MLVLYDVTSTSLGGRCCPLAHHGDSRDNRGDRPQRVIGLLCAADGCPVAVAVFEGNTADPATVAAQITKLKQRFRLRHVVLVGDRGMLTAARIEQTPRPAGLDWITATTGQAYKSLAQVERAFRCIKTVDLELRPVFHWTAPRVRAHVLLCMMAYYLAWHMRQPLAPMLFDDHGRATALAERTSPVAKKVSKAADRKASTPRTEAGDGQSQPVHSFRTLLGDLATLTRNTACFGGQKMLTVLTTPRPCSVGRSACWGSKWRRRRQCLGWDESRVNGLHQKGGKVRTRNFLTRQILSGQTMFGRSALDKS